MSFDTHNGGPAVTGTRLQLDKVDYRADPDKGRSIAVVQLIFELFEYVGRFEAEIDESPLRVISLATFDAVNKALAATVGSELNVTLRTVGRMDPVFMDLPIFIVIADVTIGNRTLKPAGAVMAENFDAYYAAAAASLDAVNRIVERMLISY